MPIKIKMFKSAIIAGCTMVAANATEIDMEIENEIMLEAEGELEWGKRGGHGGHGKWGHRGHHGSHSSSSHGHGHRGHGGWGHRGGHHGSHSSSHHGHGHHAARWGHGGHHGGHGGHAVTKAYGYGKQSDSYSCLLYTSDAADE